MPRLYKQRDLKLLWGRSGGMCAFPGCNKFLSLFSTDDVIGHIAHIVADSLDGPRGDPGFPRERLDSYENLVLLCPTHHAVVDAKNSDYSVPQLIEMKRNHEDWVRRQLSWGDAWNSNISQLYYLNIPRLAILAAYFGLDVDLSFLDSSRSLHSLGWELNRVLLSFKNLLEVIEPRATDIDDIVEFLPEQIGTTMCFKSTFRTKGVPGPAEAESFVLSGDVLRDPHIYRVFKAYRLTMTINPKWITTAIAFVNLKPPGGTARYAGLCTVKDYDPSTKQILATPLVLGAPRSPLDNLFNP